MNTEIVSFNSGEMTPNEDAVSNLEKYAAGCRHLENFLPRPYGDAERRPGTIIIRKVFNPSTLLVYPTLHELTRELPSIVSYDNINLSYENSTVESDVEEDNRVYYDGKLLFDGNKQVYYFGVGSTNFQANFVPVPILTYYDGDIVCWENETIITTGEIVYCRNIICYDNNEVFWEDDIVVASVEMPNAPPEPYVKEIHQVYYDVSTPNLANREVVTYEDDPVFYYENWSPVTTAADLQAMEKNRRYRLTTDIDLTGVTWTPIIGFSGTLDGNGHTISNLTIDYSFDVYTGGLTADATADTFTDTVGGEDFTDGTALKISGTVPTGLSSTVTYYIINSVACVRHNVTLNYLVSNVNFNSVGHTFINGDIVRVGTTGAIPSGSPSWSINTNYYVVNAAVDVFNLSTTSGGSAKTFTSNGSGQVSVYKRATCQISTSVGGAASLFTSAGSGLSFTTPPAALFESFSDGAQIYNLNFSDCDISGDDYIAVLVASISSKTGIVLKDISISNCTVIGGQYIGALIGLNFNSGGINIFSCSTINCTINTTSDVGGLIGYHHRLKAGNPNYFVDCCVNGGTITSTTGSGTAYIGGLVGASHVSASPSGITFDHFYGCYSTASVISAQGDFAGGFASLSEGVQFTNCYATGDITVYDYSASVSFFGGFIGAAVDGCIFINCYTTGNISIIVSPTQVSQIGGFAGKLECGTSTDVNLTCLRCYSTGDVDITGAAWNGVGGFVGCAWPATVTDKTSTMTIERCFARGDIALTESKAVLMTTYKGGAGGFCGWAENYSSGAVTTLTFLNCYAWGDIVDNETATRIAAYGGFLGFSQSSNASNIFSFTNCYCAQTNSEYGSGFVGKIPTGTNSHGFGSAVAAGSKTTFVVTECFYDTQTSSLSTSTSGEGQSTDEMMTKSNYIDWDFVNKWEMVEL